MDYRPCVVDGKKALFHKWVEQDAMFVKYDVALKGSKQLELKRIIDDGIIPNYAHVEKVTNTFGIVEFEDGTVAIVKPETITFLDTGNQFMDQGIFFYEFDSGTKKPWNDYKCKSIRSISAFGIDCSQCCDMVCPYKTSQK